MPENPYDRRRQPAEYDGWEKGFRDGIYEGEARRGQEVKDARRERDEYAERIEAFEEAVSENLPEVTGDADGNLETSEIVRIETVGLLYRELERDRDEARRAVVKARKALGCVGPWEWMALKYAEGGGSAGPEMQQWLDVREVLESVQADLASIPDPDAPSAGDVK